ncbi:MAG: hypothetical protein SGBAC_005821 [Bacillariaceae sp.]
MDSDEGKNGINGDDAKKEKEVFFDKTLQTMKVDESSFTKTEPTTQRPKTVQPFETYKKRPKCTKWNFQQQDFPPEVYNIDPLPADSSTQPSTPWGDVFGYNNNNSLDVPKQIENGATVSSTNDSYFRATRLVRGRSYARPNAFDLEQLYELPDLQDLASPPNPEYADDNLWTKNGALWFRTTPFRLGLLAISYFSFGPMVHFLYTHLPAIDKLESLSESNFVPGISIVYGTYLSLTLSILYSRQQKITELCAKETSQLLQLTRRVFQLFDDSSTKNTMKGKVDVPASIKSTYKISAAEFIADQVRILVKTSRGRELMKIIYSDPYEGVDKVLNDYRDELVAMKNHQQQRNTIVDVSSSMVCIGRGLYYLLLCRDKEELTLSPSAQTTQALINTCSDQMGTLVLTRSQRLSNESTFLPPAHFIVARVLAALIIIGYTIATVPIVDVEGNPPVASSAFFAVLCTVGVYQIRRSGIAANLLAIKWIIQKDPTLACEVNFEGEVGHEILWQDPLKMEEISNLKQ